MLGSEIYYNFNDEIKWIIQQFKQDIKNLPPNLKEMGRRITSDRLIAIPPKVPKREFDPEFGRPIPYTVFWFADALRYSDREAINSFALAMAYSAITSTLRDDIVDDKELKVENLRLFRLYNIFQRKYIGIFEGAFDSNSGFWPYIAKALDDQLRYETWNRAFILETCKNPFSARFIEDSSRFFAAVTMPSLAAVAVAAGAEDRIAEISRFVRHLSIVYRIHDDLEDCRADLYENDMNHSCILQYAKLCIGSSKELDESALMSLFLSESFVRKVFEPILFHLKKAKEDILAFNSSYLNKFMDEEISFNIRSRDAMLWSRSKFVTDLESLFREQLDG